MDLDGGVEQLGVLFLQQSVLGQLCRRHGKVGAYRLEAVHTGHVVNAVPLLVGRDELVSALLGHGARLWLGSRDKCPNLIDLRPKWNQVSSSQLRLGQVRAGQSLLPCVLC